MLSSILPTRKLPLAPRVLPSDFFTIIIKLVGTPAGLLLIRGSVGTF